MGVGLITILLPHNGIVVSQSEVKKSIVKWKNKCNHFHHERNNSDIQCSCLDKYVDTELTCQLQNGQSFVINDHRNEYVPEISEIKFHCKGINTKGSFNSAISKFKRINFEKVNPTIVEVRSCPISSFTQFLDALRVDEMLTKLTIRVDFSGMKFDFNDRVFSGVQEKYPDLETLTIREGGNTQILFEDGTFDPFEGLKELEMSDLNLAKLPQNLLSPMKNLAKIHWEKLTFPNHEIPLQMLQNMDHLETLSLKKTNLKNLSPEIFSNLSHLQKLDLSDNTLPHFPQHVLLRKCDNLQEFVMTKDHCSELNCVHNLADDLLSNCKNLRKFSYGKSLDSNHSVTIGNQFFSDGKTLPKLEKIELHNVNIKPDQIHSLFRPLTNLKFLDLSYNDITTLKAKDFPVGNNSKLQKLYLDGNPLSCDCDTRKGVRDLKRNLETFTYHVFDEAKRECKCNSTTVSVKDFFNTDCADVSPCTPQQKVSTPTFVIISLGLITFLLIIILVTIFISERVRIWLYHNKFFSKFFRREYEIQNEDIYGIENTYDAFISYADADSNFVERMVEVLENPSLPEHKKENMEQVGGRLYRFCIHQRDWAGGTTIIQNIRDSVKNSFRTIILLSSHFANSQWCEHEFNEAYQENKVIMIMMEGTKISDFDGNDLIQEYLKTYTYLKQEDPMLWKKLSYQLPHKSMGGNIKRNNRKFRLWRQITEDLPLVRNTSRDSSSE